MLGLALLQREEYAEGVKQLEKVESALYPGLLLNDFLISF